jgi:curved DNA-binding protein CbpA
MEEWEDYYQILGVDPEASEEEIKKAYLDWVRILHPDRLSHLPESARRRAEENLKKINRAYEVLKDPQKRKEYHSEWLKKISKAPGEAYTTPKPKPVVEPNIISFDDVEPGEIRRASFVIRNEGGPYNRIWFSNPDSWVRVIGWGLVDPNQDDELPLRVDIEAEGKEWGRSYSEYIRVKLDEEETKVRIELRTKPEPVKEEVWEESASKVPPSPPPVSSPSDGWDVIKLLLFAVIQSFWIPAVMGYLGLKLHLVKDSNEEITMLMCTVMPITWFYVLFALAYKSKWDWQFASGLLIAGLVVSCLVHYVIFELVSPALSEVTELIVIISLLLFSFFLYITTKRTQKT